MELAWCNGPALLQTATNRERSFFSIVTTDETTNVHAHSESALHIPYDVAHAQKDYEAIVVALTQLHSTLHQGDTLNASPADNLNLTKGGTATPATLDDMLHKAVSQKSEVDAAFEKIFTPASTAKSRINQ